MNCYIKSQDSDAVLPAGINKDNALFYPENAMTTQEMFTSTVPQNLHIITDSPFLIPLYKKSEVFIWKNNEWINPDMQTYGASYEYVIKRLFNGGDIPKSVLDGTVTNCMGYKLKII
jgi:hypothetical protein